MKSPTNRKTKPPRIRGGGAAARAAQFAMEHGQSLPKDQADKGEPEPDLAEADRKKPSKT